MIDKEYIPCAVCGSTAYRIIGRGIDYEFNTSQDVWESVECERCGHLFLNPRPKISEAGKIYPSDYYPPIDLSSLSSRIIANVRYLLERRRYLCLKQFLSDQPHIWDIGSGDGRVLLMLRKLYGPQLKLTAIDIAIDEKTKEVFRHHHIDFIEGLIEELPLDNVQAIPDVVIMTQVIEHLWNPQLIFRKLGGIQKKGGVIFIETPNPQSYCRKYQGNTYWGGFHRPRHLNIFTKAGLEAIGRQEGYQLRQYAQFTVPAFWIMGIRNRLGLGTRGNSGKITECISLKNVVALGLFTIIEQMCGILRAGRSNHRFIFALNRDK